jgi:hypothetical protein
MSLQNSVKLPKILHGFCQMQNSRVSAVIEPIRLDCQIWLASIITGVGWSDDRMHPTGWKVGWSDVPYLVSSIQMLSRMLRMSRMQSDTIRCPVGCSGAVFLFYPKRLANFPKKREWVTFHRIKSMFNPKSPIFDNPK